ncbi:transcriptional regulator [Streptomyces albidoflavus]|uniref:Transcriptional regulator n=1 Tax=Streptomyces albidoflavus TaxID=1886 RepID=A0A8G1ZRZ6_9ACTN|nr:helix-turn-helix transcriptional regulator [Streptomyces albidoflavus]RZE21975.1 transcriptional regulator [Streptomyces albidoflavus]
MAELLRILRRKHGYTQEWLGDLIGWTGSAISAVETHAQPVSDDMLVALEPAIGEGLGLFTVARPYINRERFPKRFRAFSLLEAEALSLSTYQNFVVDGLFQTRDYARALIDGSYPVPPPQKRDDYVEARMARKALFDRDPTPMIELILEETVLRRPFGSWEVHHGQLRSLLADSERHNVTLQVLPLDRGLTGTHAGERGPMKLVETEDHQRVIYTEIEDQGVLLTDPPVVSELTHRYGKIRSQCMTPEDSRTLIEKLAGETA